LKTLVAMSVICRRFRLSLLMLRLTIGTASASAFVTVGLSASGGSRRMARETLSRTSLAAVSISMPSSNSTVMEVRPSELVDLMVRIPSMPLMDSSRGSVIRDSITSAFAPV
jgi:hypothetical protein